MCQLCGANWQRPAKRGAQFYAKDPTGTDSKKANKLWKSPGKKLIMEAWGACEHELEEVQLRLEAAFEKIDLEGMTPVNDRRARRIFLPVLATVQFPDGWLAYAPADKIKELRVATFKMFKSDMKNRKTKQLQKAAKSEPKTSPSVPRMDAPPTPLSSSVPQRSAKPSQRPASFEKLPFGESLIYANRSGPAEPYVYVYDLCEPSKNAKDLTPRDLEWEKFNVSLVENDDQDSVVSYFVDGVGYKRITNVKGLQLALGHIYSTNGGFLELRIARKTDPGSPRVSQVSVHHADPFAATSSKRSPTAEDSARPSKVRRLNEDMRGLSVSALPSEERGQSAKPLSNVYHLLTGATF